MQWLFGKGKKTLPESGVLHGRTDWHSHILPNVDDGVQTMGEALAILQLYERYGIREVWLTPHIMEDIPNKPDMLRQKFEEFKQVYSGTVLLHLSAENMLDNLFAKRLSNGDVLPYGDDNKYLLVETSFFSPPTNYLSLLEEVKTKGYTPVLAHPERYAYMHDDEYRELKEMGVCFQLNMCSLTGQYGKQVQNNARKLLTLNYYDFAGSDIHSIGTFENQMRVGINQDTLERLAAV